MADQAIYRNTYLLPRADFANVKIWAGIDFGCSLLKVVYVSKREALDSAADPVTVQCCSYRRDQMSVVLHLLKENVHFPAGASLHVTGVGCTHHEAEIQSVLSVKTVFVQEFLAAACGLYLMVKGTKHETVFYEKAPLPNPSDFSLPPEAQMMMDQMRQKYTKNDPKDGSPFPALFLLVGSGSAIIYIDSEGRSRFVSGIPSAGKTFLGLSRLLIGTSDYNEIVAKAAKGSRLKTDLCVREMITDDPNSPYGQYPSDTAIMPFAKPVDQDRGLESFSKEDLAAGMVGLMCSQFFFFALSSAEACGVSRVYAGGGFCRSETVRSEWMRTAGSMFRGLLDFSFIRSEHTGAIGTMLTNPEDMVKYVLM